MYHPAEALEEMKRLVQRHHDELVHLLEKQLGSPAGDRSLQLTLPRASKEVMVPPKPPQQVVHYVMSNDEGTAMLDDVGVANDAAGDTGDSSWPELNGVKESQASKLSSKDPGEFLSKFKRKRKFQTKVEDCIFESTKTLVRANETPLQQITRSWYYEWLSGFLIISNSIFIGYQTQFHASDSAERSANGLPVRITEPIGILMVQAMFSLMFLLELALRWIADGLIKFFRTADYFWSIMDVLIVGFSIIDTTWNMSALANDKPVDNSVIGSVSVLRMVRVIRIVKIVRVIRIMSFFRELRIMVYSILGSMKSLLWVALILGTTFYIFAITFTAAAITHLDKTESWTSQGTKDLRTYYGTVGKSMLSLYMAMSGGQDWSEAFEALEPLPGQYQVFFLLFITFAIFAVLNIVTGVFVDTAMSSNSSGDRQIMMHEALEEKNQYLSTLRSIFEEIDRDGGGTISLAEFEEGFKDDKVMAFFRALKLDVSDTRTFFKLFDKKNEEQITMDEFLQGCYKLHGDSRSLDTKLVQRQLEFLSDSVASLRAALIQAVVAGQLPQSPRSIT